MAKIIFVHFLYFKSSRKHTVTVDFRKFFLGFLFNRDIFRFFLSFWFRFWLFWFLRFINGFGSSWLLLRIFFVISFVTVTLFLVFFARFSTLEAAKKLLSESFTFLRLCFIFRFRLLVGLKFLLA